jgi:hypothetical protein
MEVVIRDTSSRQKHQHEIDGVIGAIKRRIAEFEDCGGRIQWEPCLTGHRVEWLDYQLGASSQGDTRSGDVTVGDNFMEKGAFVALANKYVSVCALVENLS